MKEAKLLRGQVRQLLPEILSAELVLQIERSLVKLITARLDAIEKKHKDVLGFMVRQASAKNKT